MSTEDYAAPRQIASGGEIPEPLREDYRKLRKLLETEADVHQLLDLAGMADGRFMYLIQTPFATYPKFVIGTTDKDNVDVQILFKCGAEWSARNEWDRLRYPKQVPVTVP